MIKYAFICEHEGNIKRAISADLDEFKEFCHYSSLSDWGEHKQLIEKCLKESGEYVFDGNDVKYYVLQFDK